MNLNFTPDDIKNLDENEIFVFGSNTEGRHGKGAALLARQKYGAIYGQARGLQGKSYAIVTKDLKRGMLSIPLKSIQGEVIDLYAFAKKRRDLVFYVTKIGTNHAGYEIEEMAGIFHEIEKDRPMNVLIPKEFFKFEE